MDFYPAGGSRKEFFETQQQPIENPPLSPDTLMINLWSQQQSPKESLIPSLDGTRYYTRGLWSSLLRPIYLIAEKVFGYELFKTNTEKVEERTTTAFNKNKDEVLSALTTYEQHLGFLGNISNNDLVEKKKYEETIKTLTSWNQWIAPYLDEKTSKKEDWIKFEKIKRLQNVIKLESLLDNPLPIEIIANIASSKLSQIAVEEELHEGEKEKFLFWIQEINTKIEQNQSLPKRTHQLTVTLFQEALETLLLHFNAHGSIENVLLDLEIHSCNLTIKDLDQLEFRKEVYEKREITIEDKKYSLGDPLDKKEYSLGDSLNDSYFQEENRFHVYPIENYGKKNYVVVLPKRRTLLAVDQLTEIKYEQRLKLINTKDKDYCGRFKIRPYMPLALKDRKWSSKTFLHKEDFKIVEDLAEIINNFIINKHTPRNLDIRHIMLDEKGDLFSTHSYPFKFNIDAYDYISLENFVFACSGGNPVSESNPVSVSNSVVFQSIMKKSTLTNQPEKIFFNNLVKKAIEDPSPPGSSIISQLISENIKSVKIELKTKLLKKGEELGKLCTQHKNKILHAVENVNVPNGKALEEIKRIYLEEYKNLGYGCTLTDDLVKRVIEIYK